jgi:NitT/TauT family transport system substrate-binding protein
MDRKRYFLFAAAASLLAFVGCQGGDSAAPGGVSGSAKPTVAQAKGDTPSFTLWWSEYPSWSAFGVADKLGFVNGKKGVLGPIEQKWGVDIVLKQADYDPCIQAFGGGQADAVCITNMDVLSPSLGRNATAICPTSTSFGADALIVTQGVKSVEDLRGKKVYGLEKSVSQYLTVSVLTQGRMKESDITFSQMDPGAAAQAMQGKQNGFDAIVVWEPYLTQTLAKRKDVHVLADSTKIKGEIVDMIVVGNDVLKKPGGKDFAHAVIEAYYEVNKWLADPKTSDTTHVALGEKFSNLNAEEMKAVLTRCKFFGTPDKGMATFTDPSFPDIMKRVVTFSKDHGMVTQDPSISYTGGGGLTPPLKAPKVGAVEPQHNLTFDPSYMSTLSDKK